MVQRSIKAHENCHRHIIAAGDAQSPTTASRRVGRDSPRIFYESEGHQRSGEVGRVLKSSALDSRLVLTGQAAHVQVRSPYGQFC